MFISGLLFLCSCTFCAQCTDGHHYRQDVLYLGRRFPIGEKRLQKELGPPPKASSKAVSRSMKSNRAKNTSPELALRSALAAARIRGYRIHKKGVPGRPDILFPKRRLAVFVNGCYWHRCSVCALPIPKTHPEFWKKKFELNARRDSRKLEELEAGGWRVLTIWEHEVREDLAGCVERIKRAL